MVRVTRATTEPSRWGCDGRMSELPLRLSWRERVDAIVGRRRDYLVVSMVVGALVFIGVAVRARATQPSIAPPAQAALASPSGSIATGTVFVHVAGAVRHPGLYELPRGARVADALEIAGGVLRRGRVDLLNLAEVVIDGSQVVVPTTGKAGGVASSPQPEPSGVSTIDLNVADQAALESIPGVGPVTATAILQHRAELGSFTSLDQLLDVTGIGPATLESIRPYVSI